jgi:predicted acylesterase/phospholipase RssA
MKELFQEIDIEKVNKINKYSMKTYLSKLKAKFGTPDFVQCASLSEECFEDVWLETDFKNTGFITWHQIKPFIQRGLQHKLELEEEQRLYEEDRQRKIADVRRRIEEMETARLAEIERLEAEANQNIDD